LPKVLRYVAAVLGGMVVGGLVVAAIEGLGHQAYPPPADLDSADPAAMAAYAESLPAGALGFVILAWAAGAFVGGIVAARIAPAHRAVLATVIGAFILAGSVSNLLLIPHPQGFAVAAIVMIVGATFAAAAVGGRWDRRLR
jgi:hypothetical protein